MATVFLFPNILFDVDLYRVGKKSDGRKGRERKRKSEKLVLVVREFLPSFFTDLV